jgi:hypothetical protein
MSFALEGLSPRTSSAAIWVLDPVCGARHASLLWYHLAGGGWQNKLPLLVQSIRHLGGTVEVATRYSTTNCNTGPVCLCCNYNSFFNSFSISSMNRQTNGPSCKRL